MNTVLLCARDGIGITEKVLSFHAGSEGRIAIGAAAWGLVLPRNSAKGVQAAQASEVWGSYEGRMPFIYPILG